MIQLRKLHDRQDGFTGDQLKLQTAGIIIMISESGNDSTRAQQPCPQVQSKGWTANTRSCSRSVCSFGTLRKASHVATSIASQMLQRDI